MLAFTFSSATSVLASLPSSFASTVLSSLNFDLDLARALDHVRVGEDVAVLVDHEARSRSPCRAAPAESPNGDSCWVVTSAEMNTTPGPSRL